MALLRLISKSVRVALILSLRMMPSLISFRARNSRLGAPAYPLSAYVIETFARPDFETILAIFHQDMTVKNHINCPNLRSNQIMFCRFGVVQSSQTLQ
jgi:hypothetical protein